MMRLDQWLLQCLADKGGHIFWTVETVYRGPLLDLVSLIKRGRNSQQWSYICLWCWVYPSPCLSLSPYLSLSTCLSLSLPLLVSLFLYLSLSLLSLSLPGEEWTLVCQLGLKGWEHGSVQRSKEPRPGMAPDAAFNSPAAGQNSSTAQNSRRAETHTSRLDASPIRVVPGVCWTALS